LGKWGLEKLLKCYLVFDTCSIEALENVKLLTEFLPKINIKIGVVKDVEEEIKSKRIKGLIKRGFIDILKPKTKSKHITEVRRLSRILKTRKNLGEISSYVFVRNHSKVILVSDNDLVKTLNIRFGVVPWFGFSVFLYILWKKKLINENKIVSLFKKIIKENNWGSRVVYSNIAGINQIDEEIAEKLL